VTLSSRAAGATLVLAGLAAASAGLVPSDNPFVWALRIFAAGFLIAVVPGVLTVLAWRPRASFDLLELVGIGVGVSIALVQLITIGAVMYSWSIDVSLALIGGWAIIHALAAVRRSPGVTVTVSAGAAVLLVTIGALGLALYAAGSPFDTTEPRIHIAIVRRILHLEAPTLYSMYFAPDFVYTYPFPGTHYMLALMARAEGVDPFFLYQKVRGFWGMVAPVLLYGCALTIFRSPRIALVTTLVAVGLVANGAFGAVPDFSWAQLAPYTHASDLAMGVLLPALLLLASQYLVGADRRERTFFLVATLGLALTLVMVHPREIVQFLVYVTAFAVVSLATWREKSLPLRAAALAGATAILLVAYTQWFGASLATANSLVEREREGLADLFHQAAWMDLVGRPLPLLRDYLIAYGLAVSGWIPIVLLASPLALFAVRRRALALMVGTSIVCYLLIVRLPLLAIPYLYLTYFEMLYVPVRNVIFFVHLLAGVCVYLVAARLARQRSVIAIPSALGCAVLVVALCKWIEPSVTDQPEKADFLFAPVLLAYGVAGCLAWARRNQPADEGWVDNPHPRWAVVTLTLTVLLVAGTEHPESSLRRVSRAGFSSTPSALLASLPCLDDGRFCPLPPALIRFAETHVPVESVFAVDIDEQYQPALFVPQQMMAWPGEAEGLIPRIAFERYYQHYDKAEAAYGQQPFFNDRESLVERLAFIRDLNVTHVLVTPRLYTMMSAVLRSQPDAFTPRYDDGRWALYEVAMRYRGLRL
jgi:hypothetical protein